MLVEIKEDPVSGERDPVISGTFSLVNMPVLPQVDLQIQSTLSHKPADIFVLIDTKENEKVESCQALGPYSPRSQHKGLLSPCAPAGTRPGPGQTWKGCEYRLEEVLLHQQPPPVGAEGDHARVEHWPVWPTHFTP